MGTLLVKDGLGNPQTIYTLPAPGQTTKGFSLPVALASDDSAVVALGTPGDATYTDATGATAGSSVSLLKGIYGKIASLLGVQNKSTLAYPVYTTPIGAGLSYTDAARDTGVADQNNHSYAKFNAFFSADQTGTGYIDGSPDGTTWYPVASEALVANTPVVLSVPVLFRYQRARVVNGPTLQTSFVLKTSYTGA